MVTHSRASPAVLALALAAGVVACDPDDGDGAPAPAGGPPPGFATEILAAQNAVRASATPPPSPPLSPLSWSDAVAEVAQAWADGCVFEHNPRLRELSLGENLAATAPPGSRSAAAVVALWADEARFYDRDANACDASNPANEPGTCGHYTQLVWRSTTAVGCAVRTCTTGSPFPGAAAWELWVCDYAPPGNVVGQRPY